MLERKEELISELDLVVFDMAGTTVGASDQGPAAFQEAFEQVGVTLSDGEIQSVRGRSKREAISELLTRHLNAEERTAARKGSIQRLAAHSDRALQGAWG